MPAAQATAARSRGSETASEAHIIIRAQHLQLPRNYRAAKVGQYSFVAANMNVTNICATFLCTVMRLSPTSPTLTWLLHSRKTHVCSSGNFGTSSSIPLPKTYSITFLFLKGYLISLWFHNRFFVALLKRQCAGGAAAHLQDVLVRLNFNGFYDLRGDSATV